MKERLTKAVITVTKDQKAEIKRKEDITAALGEKAGSREELANTYVSVIEAGIEAIGKASTPEEATRINEGVKLVYKEALKLTREMDSQTLGLENSLDMGIKVNCDAAALSTNQKGVKDVLSQWNSNSNQMAQLKSSVKHDMDLEQEKLAAQQTANTPMPVQQQTPQPALRTSVVVNPGAPPSQAPNIDANRVIAAKPADVKDPAAALQSNEYVNSVSAFIQSDEYKKASPQEKERLGTEAFRKGVRAIAMANDEASAAEINKGLKVVFKELDQVAKQNGKTEQQINSDIGLYQRIARRGSKEEPRKLGGDLKPLPNWRADMLDQWNPNVMDSTGQKGLRGTRANLDRDIAAAAEAVVMAKQDAALSSLNEIVTSRPRKPDYRTNDDWDALKTRAYQEDFQIKFNNLPQATQNELSAYVNEDKNGLDLDKVSNKLAEYAKADKLDQFNKLLNVCPPEMQVQVLKSKELQDEIGKGVVEGNKKVYDYLKGQGADLAGADKVVSDKAAADKAIADKAIEDKAIADKAAASAAAAQPKPVIEPKKAEEKKPLLEKPEVKPVPEKPEVKPAPEKPEVKPAPEKPEVKPAPERRESIPDKKKPAELPPEARGSVIGDMAKVSAGMLGLGAALGAAAGICFIFAPPAVPFLVIAGGIAAGAGVTIGAVATLAKLVDVLVVKPIKWLVEKVKSPAQEKELNPEKEPLLKAEQDVNKEKPVEKDYSKLAGVAEASKALKNQGAREAGRDSTIQKPATPSKNATKDDASKNPAVTTKNSAAAQR